jgi:pilus assembly protein CpaF
MENGKGQLMSLRDRLGEIPEQPAQVDFGSRDVIGVAAGRESSPPPDAVAELRRKAQEALFGRIGNRLYDPSVTLDQLRTLVMGELNEIISENDISLSDDERKALVAAVAEDVLGYGPIQEFLDDPTVTEIMVNTTETIYIERNGRLIETPKRFFSADHLRRLIERMASQVGRRIDESSPMVDARLPDGSRINAVIPPLAVDGPMLTVRKFARRSLSGADLVDLGSMTPGCAAFLGACVEARISILVSGGTGSGKTTLLNALSGYVGDHERIVTIEDAVELQVQQRHRIRLESRPANVEGKGLITIRDLVRNALRMRPDRIIVGEVRGPEALDMLQAMNTGHEGSLTTLHANSPRDALARLETMVLMAGMDLPLQAVREQIASAVDLIVHIGRMGDGSRKLMNVAEVTGMESSVIQLNDLFALEHDSDGSVRQSMPTGIRPSFETRLRRHGVELGPDLTPVVAKPKDQLRVVRGSK